MAPTLDVLVLFFLQTTDLTLIVPFFKETTNTTKAKSDQRKLSAKGAPFQFLLFQRNLQNRTRLKGPVPVTTIYRSVFGSSQF